MNVSHGLSKCTCVFSLRPQIGSLLRKIKGRQIRDHIFCLQSHVLNTILTYQGEFVMIGRKK